MSSFWVHFVLRIKMEPSEGVTWSPIGTLFSKVLPDSRRNLTISHLVNCFKADDAPAKFVFLETLLQLALGLTRSKYQN